MLKVQGLSFLIMGQEVLKDISFQLDRHDILCLLGPNGTGKTTMLRCLLSLNKIKNGTIEIDGVDFTKATVRERAEMVAYVPQATAMAFSYESFEVVLMGRIAHLPTGGKPTAR